MTTENPFKPITESETPKPKAPAAKSDQPRVHRYRWPGEYPEGCGDFKRVSEAGEHGRAVGGWMKR